MRKQLIYINDKESKISASECETRLLEEGLILATYKNTGEFVGIIRNHDSASSFMFETLSTLDHYDKVSEIIKEFPELNFNYLTKSD